MPVKHFPLAKPGIRSSETLEEFNGLNCTCKGQMITPHAFEERQMINQEETVVSSAVVVGA